jgi:hypothetical protein
MSRNEEGIEGRAGPYPCCCAVRLQTGAIELAQSVTQTLFLKHNNLCCARLAAGSAWIIFYFLYPNDLPSDGYYDILVDVMPTTSRKGGDTSVLNYVRADNASPFNHSLVHINKKNESEIYPAKIGLAVCVGRRVDRKRTKPPHSQSAGG